MSTFDFSTSNIILMVGGQILMLLLALFVILFGTKPVTSPLVGLLAQPVGNQKNSS